MTKQDRVQILVQAVNQASAEIKKIQSDLAGVGTSGAAATGQTTALSGAMTTGMKSAALAIGGALAGFIGIREMISKTVGAWINYERVLNRVTFAVGKQKIGGYETVQQIRDLADEFEHVSGVAEETILQTYSRLITSGKSLSDSTRIVKLGLDIVAQSGEDLESTVVALIKGMAGSTMMMNRLAASLGLVTIEGEKVENTLGRITERVSGAAAAQMQGMVGTTNRLKDAWDDLFRMAGEGFEHFVGGIEMVWTAQVRAAKAANDTTQSFRGMFTELFGPGKVAEIKAHTQTVDEYVDAWLKLRKMQPLINAALEERPGDFQIDVDAPKMIEKLAKVQEGIDYGLGSFKLRPIRIPAEIAPDITAGDEAIEEFKREAARRMDLSEAGARGATSLLQAFIEGTDSIEDLFKRTGLHIVELMFKEMLKAAPPFILEFFSLFSFDNPVNDLMAQRWGRDYVTHFMRGASAQMRMTGIDGHVPVMQSSGGAASPVVQHFNFYGVTSDDFINGRVFPAIERAKRTGALNIDAGPGKKYRSEVYK